MSVLGMRLHMLKFRGQNTVNPHDLEFHMKQKFFEREFRHGFRFVNLWTLKCVMLTNIKLLSLEVTSEKAMLSLYFCTFLNAKFR